MILFSKGTDFTFVYLKPCAEGKVESAISVNDVRAILQLHLEVAL